MKRRIFKAFLLMLLLAVGRIEAQEASQNNSADVDAMATDRPNVLFIAVDDLNDWVGCLGGNPDARTPNIDRFAKRSVLFNNAHCQVALCSASRSSALTGMYASTTGIYGNSTKTATETFRKATQMPVWFRENGYRTMCMGKIYHNDHGKKIYWDEVGPKTLRWGPEPPDGRQFAKRFGNKTQDSLAWAALDIARGEMPDEQIATWGKAQLDKKHDAPFFLALGFYKPHTPMTAPKRYFDLFDREQLTMPTVLKNDLDDVPEFGRKWVMGRQELIADDAVDQYSPTYRRELVHAYHACVALTDDCVGQVLRHLEQSEYADNTIVVLWSDHGWHLGEKHHWRKWMPWEESTRSLMAVHVPGRAGNGSVCSQTVGLIDMYPTLAKLCDLKAPPQLQGLSFDHLLDDPQGPWERPALTSTQAGSHTVRSQRWRYIRYADGSEELYDHDIDPNEWTNLADRSEYQQVKVEHGKWIDELTAGEKLKQEKQNRQPKPPKNKLKSSESKTGNKKLAIRNVSATVFSILKGLKHVAGGLNAVNTPGLLVPSPATPKGVVATLAVTTFGIKESLFFVSRGCRFTQPTANRWNPFGIVGANYDEQSESSQKNRESFSDELTSDESQSPTRKISTTIDDVESAKSPRDATPNVILIMSDDQGWGDVGFNGNEVLETPNLDAMAAGGMRLDRFYTSAPLCSPTRGSCLTGRYPFRFGILAAHTAGMRVGEITIPEMLKKKGYQSGFFGKWHLGWVKPADAGSRGFYSPPNQHGFDEYFATTSAVPTWNPTVTPENWSSWGAKGGEPWKGGAPYVHNGEEVTENMDGDDSRVIMDRVIPFVEANKDKPFFAAVWFHAPHDPVVAGDEYKKPYAKYGQARQNLYGCITAMDEQVGRLREKLRELNLEKSTIVFFCSDNGPADSLAKKGIASAGPFKGHKHTMNEGGLLVPACVEWPGTIPAGQSTTVRCSTVDFFPTIANITGYKFAAKDARPIDGIDLMPVINGEVVERGTDLFFGYRRLHSGIDGNAIISGDWKLMQEAKKNGKFRLYDLGQDPYEASDLFNAMPEQANALLLRLQELESGCQRSRDGADYKY